MARTESGWTNVERTTQRPRVSGTRGSVGDLGLGAVAPTGSTASATGTGTMDTEIGVSGALTVWQAAANTPTKNKSLRSTARPEEVFEKITRRISERSTCHLDPMIQPFVLNQVAQTSNHAGFGVRSPEDEPPDSR